MGLCFNNEIFFQMAKGLIHPEFLEVLSYNKVLVGTMIAPSLDIKQVYDEDEDYRYYMEQILDNMNETHAHNR